MAFLIPGDICDLRALLIGKMDHAVAALNKCRVATISRQKIFDAMETYPRIELALWRDTMLDAALYRQWLINLGRRAAHQRIAHLLCEIWTRLQAIGRAQDAAYELPITQSDLADAVGFSLVHVNKSLKRLREDGLITSGRTKSAYTIGSDCGRLQGSTLPICNCAPSHRFSRRIMSKLCRVMLVERDVTRLPRLRPSAMSASCRGQSAH